MDSLQKYKLLIRHFLEVVVNTADFTRLPELAAADCVETDGKLRVLSRVSGMADHIRPVRPI
jgi:hypothetical protein